MARTSAGYSVAKWLWLAWLPVSFVGCAKAKPAGPAPIPSAAALPACEQERSPFARDACYAREAKNNAQPGLCLYLQTPDKQTACVAATGDGIAACQQASTIAPVPDCFRDVAFRIHDAKACDFIRSSYERGVCFATLASMAQNPALCSSVPRPQQQDECWSNVARSRNDPKLCDSVKNAYRRDNCRLQTAKQDGGQGEGCARIENPALRDDCWVQLAEKDGAPADVCEHVTARKNGCYMALARRQGLMFCDRIGAGTESIARRLCYEELFATSRLRNSADFCAPVTDVVQKQQCALARADATRDVGLCEGIALPEIADDCFAVVASKTPEACLRIKDPGRLRQCASMHWTGSRDPRICAPLLPKARQDCNERMAKRH